jgi:hypothetical protein
MYPSRHQTLKKKNITWTTGRSTIFLDLINISLLPHRMLFSATAITPSRRRISDEKSRFSR